MSNCWRKGGKRNEGLCLLQRTAKFHKSSSTQDYSRQLHHWFPWGINLAPGRYLWIQISEWTPLRAGLLSLCRWNFACQRQFKCGLCIQLKLSEIPISWKNGIFTRKSWAKWGLVEGCGCLRVSKPWTEKCNMCINKDY